MSKLGIRDTARQLHMEQTDELLETKIGLVLAGGGAKGAYEAGALRYMSEIGFCPAMIAGTSIGALNGAVLASHPSFSEAVQKLEMLWDRLGSEKVLQFNKGSLKRFAYAGASSFLPNFVSWYFDFISRLGIKKDSLSIFSPDSLEQLLSESINTTELRRGIELWVAVFPTLKIPGLDYDYLTGLLQVLAGSPAQWLKVQDCEDDATLHNLLLASAAIPFAFPPREINGTYYVDGALGDNVPLGALAARGCTHAVVIHLSPAVNWSRHAFPSQAILEIRPRQFLNTHKSFISGGIRSLLDFSPESISGLKELGYRDAKYYLDEFLLTWNTVNQKRFQSEALVRTTVRLQNDLPL